MSNVSGRSIRRGRAALVVVLAACLVPVLSGCVLVGDSVSAFMTPQLHTVVPIVDADFGRSLEQHGWQTKESAAQAVRRWEGMHPPWIIIQVGANDVNATGDSNVWRASIRDTLSSVPASQCVGWVLVYDVRQPARSDQFNAVVEQEVTSTHPKHVFVPWPDQVKRGGMLIDAVHLSNLGTTTLTRLIGETVATFGRMGCH
jgi:hypothetical protein